MADDKALQMAKEWADRWEMRAYNTPVALRDFLADRIRPLLAQIEEVERRLPGGRSARPAPRSARGGALTKLRDMCCAWPRRTFAQRLEDCRLLLHISGYLRDSESARIRRKIQRDWEREGAEKKP